MEVRDGGLVLLKGDLMEYRLLLGNVYFQTRERVQQQLFFLEKCISELLLSSYFLTLGEACNVIMNEEMEYFGSKINL